MRCHVCGTEVLPQHKFCMECGARLQRPSGELAPAPPSPDDDATGRLPALSGPTRDDGHPLFDPATGQLLAAPPPPPPPLPPPDDDATNVLPAIGAPTNTMGPSSFGPPDVSARGPGQWDHRRADAPAWPPEPSAPVAGPPASYAPSRADYAAEYDTSGYDTTGYDATGRVPATYTAWEVAPWPEEAEPVAARAGFRPTTLLIISILAAAGAAVVAILPLLDVTAPGQPVDGEWKVNDFGTNLTVAGIVTAVVMVLGGVAWSAGFRWGAGLAGGAGAALAGWAILAVGQVELFRSAASGGASEVTRGIGFWALAAAGGFGLFAMLVSLGRAGADGRAGLDPWVAALGAMATIAAVVGPLIPVNDADLDLNWASPPGSDLPTIFFVSRFAQLGLLLLSGVFGFLLVRRYGLGLAIGGAICAGWLVLTSATGQTDAPIGLAVTNPGADPDFVTAAGLIIGFGIGKPHIVTIVGVGLVFFFGLVATAMALIDDR